MYSKTNRPALAIGVYKQALRLSPQQASLLLNLGLAYLKQEDYTHALPEFRKVEQLDPSSRQAKELIATCQVFSGAESDAIPRLEGLRASDTNKTGVLYLLGVAYTRLRQPEKAKPIFAELLGAAANAEQSGLLMGRAYYESGQFENAEHAYSDALKANADSREARLGLGKTYISERKTADAITELQRILAKNPNDADAHYYLGALLLETRQQRQAQTHLEFADKAFPNSSSVAFYLGRLALQEGRYPAAVTYLRRSTALNDRNDAAFYALARALKATGQTGEAKTALEHVRRSKEAALKKEQQTIGSIPPAP